MFRKKGSRKHSLESMAGEKNNSYQAKPSIVDLSEKYDLPSKGGTDCDFEDIKHILTDSKQFSRKEIDEFKKSNDIRYFLADLDSGDFSKERVETIIDRYKNNSSFRKEFRSLLE
ncbi:MAG: hypothetical protein ACQESC_04200 [Nanobdellota archaeon]